MLLYPEVQRKVHEEIDRVVGRERFPEFSDQESLPYTTAVCREVSCWAIDTPSVPDRMVGVTMGSAIATR